MISAQPSQTRAARRVTRWLYLVVGTSLALLSACTLTSDLEDLRQRVEEAKQSPSDPCEVMPDDPLCVDTVMCSDNSACEGYCDADNLCRPDTCKDQVKSPGETAIDCGGEDCAQCALNKGCLVNSDCASNYCAPSKLCAVSTVPQPPTDGGSGGGSNSDDGGVEPDGGVHVDACYPGCSCVRSGGVDRIYCTGNPMPWTGAVTWCEMHDTVLTSIESRMENDALGNTADWLGLDEFWIGGSDRSQEGDWRWTDGTQLWEGGPAECPEGTVQGPGNRCYLATPLESFSGSYQRCLVQGEGWSLVRIESSTENEFVRNLIVNTAADKNYAYVEGWIGANDLAEEGVWGWVLTDPDPARVEAFWMGGASGGRVDPNAFTYWTGGDPGGGSMEDCALMIGSSGRWTDGACGFNGRMGICEGPLRGPIEGNFQAMADDEPSAEDCLSYVTGDFDWRARACSESRPFVCSAQ